jgi:hypothetical protein
MTRAFQQLPLLVLAHLLAPLLDHITQGRSPRVGGTDTRSLAGSQPVLQSGSEARRRTIATPVSAQRRCQTLQRSPEWVRECPRTIPSQRLIR